MNNENELNILAGISTLIFIVCGMGYMVWASAFVSVHLWIWFVVPVFGLTPLTMPQAYGIALLVNYWTYHHTFSQFNQDKKEWSEQLTEIFTILIIPWLYFVCGWICYNFFMK